MAKKPNGDQFVRSFAYQIWLAQWHEANPTASVTAMKKAWRDEKEAFNGRVFRAARAMKRKGYIWSLED